MSRIQDHRMNQHAVCEPSPPDEFREARENMVREQLAARDIRSPAVLDAMGRVPRELFVPESARRDAYLDSALPIACDQTISQPYIVAKMTELLEIEPRSRVLEIGGGCGYQTAVLALLSAQVYSIEWHPQLAEQAESRLKQLGFSNVFLRCGDGSLGWPEAAPFDRILLTASPPRVPEALKQQLTDDGVLVAPVGPLEDQVLVRMRRKGDRITSEQLMCVRFVPMVGRSGWQSKTGV